ncbi:IME2 Meiosis induction protein kinase IME2/SME1 [Candida maltosa Xu316]|uniref:Protein kinase domain-containing protein n=1 Tax=Candida maltosa (strain Xu316) TaxID=1245528 RepID=M3HMH8_CANMX|nr:hypothetical protein G210_0766 [Candida maltosa Xu316]
MSKHTSSYPLDYDCPPKHLSFHSYQEKYQNISNLGNGSFGTVELAKYKFHKFDLLKLHEEKTGTLLHPLEDSKCNPSNLVAIKTMKKKLPLLQDYANVKEVKFILSIPSHPCLVQIFEMFIDDVQFQLHITMEAMNQNLYQLIKSRRNIKFSSVTLRSILSQLLCAIRHIHKWNYFHRDVKPENILVIPTLHFYGSKAVVPPYRKNDNFIIKLGDYGLARHVSNTKPYTAYVSTRWYRSPEILLRQKWYSRPIDIWAFGAVAVEIANFVPLFPGTNELDQIWKILRVLGSPFVPDPNVISSNYVVPLGGYWNDAVFLANKLSMKIPYEPGMNVEDVIQHPDADSLQEIIQNCLLWDPSARIDANGLAQLQYFKDTITMMDNYFENEPVSMNETINKLVGIPNSPSGRKLVSMTHTQRNILNMPKNDYPLYQELEDGYENYFDQLVEDPCGDENIATSDGYKLISHSWMPKIHGVIDTEESRKEPRDLTNANHEPSHIGSNKRSFTTFSLESEEVTKL